VVETSHHGAEHLTGDFFVDVHVVFLVDELLLLKDLVDKLLDLSHMGSPRGESLEAGVFAIGGGAGSRSFFCHALDVDEGKEELSVFCTNFTIVVKIKNFEGQLNFFA
jgi:hypothetical protein